MPTARERVSALVDDVISLGNRSREEASVTVTKTLDNGFTFVIDGQHMPNINKAEEYVADLHASIGAETDPAASKELVGRRRRIKMLESSVATLQAAIAAENVN